MSRLRGTLGGASARAAFSDRVDGGRSGAAIGAVGAPALAVRAFERQKRHFFTWCVAPSLAVLAVITLLPALYLLATSFTPLDLTRPETQWSFATPLQNYRL